MHKKKAPTNYACKRPSKSDPL